MNNIANERKKLGITQSALAGACGWNQSRLANYESGKADIRIFENNRAGQTDGTIKR